MRLHTGLLPKYIVKDNFIIALDGRDNQARNDRHKAKWHQIDYRGKKQVISPIANGK
jgi:hypothetical protein